MRVPLEYFEGERYLNTGGADGFFILTGVQPDHSCFEVSNSGTSRDRLAFRQEIERVVCASGEETHKQRNGWIHRYDAYCLVVEECPHLSFRSM